MNLRALSSAHITQQQFLTWDTQTKCGIAVPTTQSPLWLRTHQPS